MKKTIGIFSLLAGILLGACSQEESGNPYAVEHNITIDSAQVLFQAVPSTGVIHVSAAKGITKVESEKDWCQTAVNGNEVTVTVSQNTAMESRASLVKIYSGESYASVTVQQMGAVVAIDVADIVTNNDKAQTLTYTIKHNVDVKFSAKADWIKVKETDGQLVVTLAENATGQLRKDYIYYTAGTLTDSIAVTQCEFEKDIPGEYSIRYMNKDQKWEALPATITKDSIVLMPNSKTPMRMAYTYNAAKCQIEVKAGQYLGKVNDYFLFLACVHENGDWSGYGGKQMSYARFDVDKASGLIFAEVDSKENSAPFMAWTVRAFSANEMTEKNNLGNLLVLIFPTFVKMTDSGAKAMNLPDRR